jgi:redox-sensitive bicupin YhaK (pirin superfamily)
LRVFLGALSGSTSPITTHSPLLGAEILLEPGTALELTLDPAFEHGVLLDAGILHLDGQPVAQDHLAFLPVGRTSLALSAGEEAVRMLLIGGEPLGEQILMWWNFVGRSHEEIVSYREQWQTEIGAETRPDFGGTLRFGTFPAGQPAPLPAPALPTTRLRPRS